MHLPWADTPNELALSQFPLRCPFTAGFTVFYVHESKESKFDFLKTYMYFNKKKIKIEEQFKKLF